MKMFKKLMAVVLTGALAVSMLTGCALGDAAASKALEKALNSDSVKSKYTYSAAKYESAAKDVWKNKLGEGKNVELKQGKMVFNAQYKGTNYVCYVVETPDSAKKAVNWAADAKDIDMVMSLMAKKTGEKNDKIKIDVCFESYKAEGAKETTYYAIVIAKA